MTRKAPSFPNEGGQPDESWAAYVDDKDWGIGAYFRDKKQITPGCVHEYDLFVTIGDVSKLRRAFQAIHEERRKRKLQP